MMAGVLAFHLFYKQIQINWLQSIVIAVYFHISICLIVFFFFLSSLYLGHQSMALSRQQLSEIKDNPIKWYRPTPLLPQECLVRSTSYFSPNCCENRIKPITPENFCAIFFLWRRLYYLQQFYFFYYMKHQTLWLIFD